jgi:F-type H+-transporting ATPase subunit b
MRFLLFALKLCPAGIAALVAVPLWAQEAEKAGLPPLNTKFYPGQVFWLVISFTVLYVLMARFALPGIERTQAKRQAIIAAELTAANAANEAARKTIAEYEKILADARLKAVTAEDMSHAAKEAIESQAEQQKVLIRQVHQAEVRIGVARDAAMREVEAAATELANTIIEKVTGLKLQVKP